MPSPVLHRRHVLDRSSISERQLHTWLNRGLISTTSRSNIQGSSHGYTTRDLVVIETASRLRDLGMPLEVVERMVAAALSSNLPVDRLIVASCDDMVFTTDEPSEILSLTDEGRVVVAIAVGPIAAELAPGAATQPLSAA